MKVNKEFIDKNFSTIHLSFLQTIVFRQSFINHNLGGAVDSCIIQIVCWHHLTSLLNDNLKKKALNFRKLYIIGITRLVSIFQQKNLLLLCYQNYLQYP